MIVAYASDTEDMAHAMAIEGVITGSNVSFSVPSSKRYIQIAPEAIALASKSDGIRQQARLAWDNWYFGRRD